MTTRHGGVVATLTSQGGRAVSLGCSPETITVGAGGWSWTAVDRQGRKPLAYPNALEPKTLSFSHTISRQMGLPVDTMLAAFRSLANTARPVRLAGMPAGASGWWRIESLSATVDQLAADNRSIHTATVSWQLTEFTPDTTPKIGRTAPPKAPPGGYAYIYVVPAGEDLYWIAAAQLDDGTRWKEIARLNGLTSAKVAVGTRLKMPIGAHLPRHGGSRPPV